MRLESIISPEEKKELEAQ